MSANHVAKVFKGFIGSNRLLSKDDFASLVAVMLTPDRDDAATVAGLGRDGLISCDPVAAHVYSAVAVVHEPLTEDFFWADIKKMIAGELHPVNLDVLVDHGGSLVKYEDEMSAVEFFHANPWLIDYYRTRGFDAYVGTTVLMAEQPGVVVPFKPILRPGTHPDVCTHDWAVAIIENDGAYFWRCTQGLDDLMPGQAEATDTYDGISGAIDAFLALGS